MHGRHPPSRCRRLRRRGDRRAGDPGSAARGRRASALRRDRRDRARLLLRQRAARGPAAEFRAPRGVGGRAGAARRGALARSRGRHRRGDPRMCRGRDRRAPLLHRVARSARRCDRGGVVRILHGDRHLQELRRRPGTRRPGRPLHDRDRRTLPRPRAEARTPQRARLRGPRGGGAGAAPRRGAGARGRRHLGQHGRLLRPPGRDEPS